MATQKKEPELTTSEWQPNTPEFWESTAKPIAWRTLWITTFCLLLSFATWFMVSAIAVKLTGIGFNLSKQQLFWLTAMPGLAAGTLRIVHTFLIPMFGTRKTVAVSTLLLAIPAVGWGVAVMNPNTSFTTFMVLAFLAGLGGGNFSSFMPSTSLFFPKRLQGLALGIQAGVGNFGVSVVQFLVPAIIGLAIYGSSQTFVPPPKTAAPAVQTQSGSLATQTQPGTAATQTQSSAAQTEVKATPKPKTIYLQNASFVWLPFVLIGAIMAWFGLRSVPVQASFKEQLDIFNDKHTWLMTSLYVMTFGTFSGLSASFPLLIKQLYVPFDSSLDPLKFAFLGPLVGASVRVVFGPIADKVGGAKVTLVSGIGLLACAIAIAPYTNPNSMESWNGFLYLMLGLFFFSGIGNASTFKQIPMIFPPRQAGGVIGWTSAIAAYGPFIISVLLLTIMGEGKNASPFFLGLAGFFALNIVLNWWFYARKGAEKPC